MPQFPVGDVPVQVSQSLTQEGILTNNGDATLFLDTESSVGQFSAGIILAPHQSMNWTSGELWAVCAAGERTVLNAMYGANTTVAPFTTISGEVNAEITGPVTIDVIESVVDITGQVTQPFNTLLDVSAVSSSGYASAVLPCREYNAITVTIRGEVNALFDGVGNSAIIAWYVNGVVVSREAFNYFSRGPEPTIARATLPVRGEAFVLFLDTLGTPRTLPSVTIVGQPSGVRDFVQTAASNLTGDAFASFGATLPAGSQTFVGEITSRAGAAHLSVRVGQIVGTTPQVNVSIIDLSTGVTTTFIESIQINGASNAAQYFSRDLIIPSRPVAFRYACVGTTTSTVIDAYLAYDN